MMQQCTGSVSAGGAGGMGYHGLTAAAMLRLRGESILLWPNVFSLKPGTLSEKF